MWLIPLLALPEALALGLGIAAIGIAAASSAAASKQRYVVDHNRAALSPTEQRALAFLEQKLQKGL